MKRTLLDLGNVVVRVDFQPFFSWVSQTGKFPNPEDYQFFLRSSLFYDFEFGQIPRDDFYRRSKDLLGFSAGRDEFEEKFCAIFPGLVPGIESVFEESGPVFCLTNTNEIHLEYIQKNFPILERFQTIFSSFDLQKRKPYPGIYREVAKRLECDPRDILFFDDVEANVVGAKRAGLEAQLFQGVEPLLQQVKDFQTLVDRANEGELL